MSPKICRSCAALWALGLVGMWVARAVLAMQTADVPFRVASSLWILGGLGYTGFGLMALVSRNR